MPPAAPVPDASPVEAPSRRLRGWVAAAVLLLLAALCVVSALSGSPVQRSAPMGLGQLPFNVAPVALPGSVPVELRIPAIGVVAPVSGLGLNPDGTAQLPGDDRSTGWYQPGPAPGELGSAVILGHVDSYVGPAVFFRLSSLRPGDRIEVALADRRVAYFLVQSVVTYSKSQFPTQDVYGPRGYSALQLVTCGGQFDHARRSYLSNVVAYTALVGVV